MACLYIVATPIGNLSDMTLRGVDVLKSVDLIACEDTRHTRILLDRYKIDIPTVSYHQHSSLQKIDWLVDQLRSGRNVALVTDAGTPGISDPGGVLVDKVHTFNDSARAQDKIEIISIPGPSSVAAALSVSGFPADHYLFLGFLPKKKGRQTLLHSLPNIRKQFDTETVVFFESPLRVHATLIDISEALGTIGSDKVNVCLARELTKKFEEIWRGDLSAAIEKTAIAQKGEFVVVLHFSK